MTLAETYDRVSDFQFEAGKALVEKLGLRKHSRVLDVGCGTGRLAHWMAERAGTVIGIDPVAERIDVARSRAASATFEIGRAEDLRAFADASFDAVCMSSVFHWVTDKPKALAEARRVLRPGGRLGMTTVPGELSKAATVNQVLETLPVDRSMLTFASRGCTTTELVTLILESGLELRELHVTESARTYASGEAVVDFMEASAFGTFLRPVPEQLRASLRADLVAAFEARKGDEGVVVRAWSLELVCVAR